MSTSAAETLRASRLLLRRLRPEDFDFMLRMNRDPRVMRFIGGPRSEEKTRAFMEEVESQWKERGYGVYLVFDAASGEPVGRTGLRYREVGGAWETDLGYSFLPEHWGKGYAREVGAVVLEVGFSLGLESIVAFTETGNAASRRVMEKLGLRFEKDIVFNGTPHVLYRVARRLL